MGEKTLLDKYSVVEMLYSDSVQSVYYVNNLFSKHDSYLILNELKDPDVIPNLVQIFLDSNEELKKTFIEFSYTDSKFYVVAKLSPGQPLAEFIEGSNLELDEKVEIAASFVDKLAQLEQMPLILQYVLCNFRNISVVERKSVLFSLMFSFTHEDFKIKKEQLITRVGDILLAIFAGSLYACSEDINRAPPQFSTIIRKCLEKEYQSTSQINEDFKNIITMVKNEKVTSMEPLNSLDDSHFKQMERIRKRKMRDKKGQYIALSALFMLAAFLGFALSGARLTDFGNIFSTLTR